ncbi:DMT family transporter [Spirulina sp. 06S082]|uniref:DMT family transporter n=1 Tax=Spirulina sp. 06S082 TaxID=3110248 RepID=UPI002B1FDEE6|nr:DMT family transporter [Spirulina sp. 06S082]MEA5471956.1 DMT family transporter [Spirulina sp. 06S082]
MTIRLQLTDIKIIRPQRTQVTFIALSLGVVLLSLSAILTKSLMAELHPEAIIFNRFWIASVALGSIYCFQNAIAKKNGKEILTQEPLTLQHWLLLMGAGMCLAGTLITWALSFDLTTIAHSCLLHYQNPIFTTLGAWLLFGQSFDRKFILGLILTITGASIVSLEDLQFLQGSLFGDGLALFSGILFSGELLIIGKLRDKLSTLTVTLGVCFFSGLFAFPFAVFDAVLHGHSLFPTSLSGWVLVVSLGFIVQVLGHFLFYYSLKQVTSGFAAIALMLDISISSFLAWIIFAEQLTMLDRLSLPILFLGIYLAKSGEGVEKSEQLREQSAIAS